MLSLIAFALLSGLVRAQDTLLSLTGSEATVYYDLTNSLCGDNDPFPTNWGETSGINNGVPYCQGSTDKSLADLGTNRIVAVNATMMQGDPSEWCGKEVELVDSSGNTFSFSEGSLFIWDACAAATSSHIVDLSAKAFTELKGGTCGGNNPTGLTINILNSNVWEAGSGGGPGSGSGSSATSSTPSSTSAVVPVASSAAATSRGPSRTTFASASQATQAGTGSTGTRIGEALVADKSSSAAISASAAASSAISSAAVVSAAANSASFGNTAATATASTASSASSSRSGSTSGDCTYGAWQCDGLQLQVCNYVSVSSLGWETIETCTSTCDVTSSGSIDCE